MNDDAATNAGGPDTGAYGDDFYARPPIWKLILAFGAVLAGIAVLPAAIILRGLPGLAIGAALAAGLIVPGAWWLWHEHRGRRAAFDPDAPAAVLDRRWRFIAPIAVVLLALGSVLAVALPDPSEPSTPTEEETSSHRTPPKPSTSSKPRSATRTATSTTATSKTTSSSTSSSSASSSSSTRPTTSSSNPGGTTPPTSTRPTTEPTTQPTQPTTRPTQPTTQPTQPTTQPTQPNQPTQPTTNTSPQAGTG